MSEDVYVLKNKKSEDTLEKMNGMHGFTGFKKAIDEIVLVHGKEDVIDMVNACWSGKKIVNPLSPREELRKVYERHNDYVPGEQAGIEIAIKIIAKEHPDVGDWLKEDDPNG